MSGLWLNAVNAACATFESCETSGFGLNDGFEYMARIAPVLTSKSTTEPRWNPSAACAARCRSARSESTTVPVLLLPEDLRFTVTAHFWSGLAVKEIAAIEEITTVAIRKRLHKAFTLLEEALGANVEEEEQ